MEAKKTDGGTEKQSFKNKHSFSIFITGSIIVSICIVIIAMAMYNSSGAAQLDLSRPGYVSVRSQAADGESDFQSFSSVGTLDKKVIEDFKKLYDKQAQKLKAVDAFGGSPLSPESIGVGTTTIP
jgi:hypothetical protein